MKRTAFKRAVLIRTRSPLGRLTRQASTALGAMRKPIPKEDAFECENYRRLVASFPCAHCSLEGYSNACHADLGKGMGIKSDDRTCWPGCVDRPGRRGCHTLVGATGTFTKEQRRTLELGYAIGTIHRVVRLGLWPAGVPFPEWFPG